MAVKNITERTDTFRTLVQEAVGTHLDRRVAEHILVGIDRSASLRVFFLGQCQEAADGPSPEPLRSPATGALPDGTSDVTPSEGATPSEGSAQGQDGQTNPSEQPNGKNKRGGKG